MEFPGADPMLVRLFVWRNLTAALIGVAIAGCLPSAFAQRIYTCKDANGKTITSDRPLPECQGREGRELSKQGTTLRTIEGALTPEQIAVREKEAQKKREEDELRKDQLRRDKALLNTYANLDDIESKRQRALSQVEREARASRNGAFLLWRDRPARTGPRRTSTGKSSCRPISSANRTRTRPRSTPNAFCSHRKRPK